MWQQRCSVGFRRFGFGGGTNIPLIRVALYSNFMIICGFSTTVIPYENIVKVSWNRSFLSTGSVRLSLRELKSSYVLYPRDPRAFVALLEARLTLGTRGIAAGEPAAVS